jgi:hypothetical protein
MSFPRTPVNGQTTVTNNIVYTYNSNNRAWKKQFGTIAVGTATVTILDDSSSPITGALTVPGGVSIKGNLYAGGKIYTQGWEISTSTYIQFNTATTLFNTATQSIKLIGGSQGSIPYQNSSNNTGFISIGPAGNVLQSNGTTAQWVTTSTGLGFGISTATDVAFKLATTATNLVGYSIDWGSTPIGGIPIQFSGAIHGMPDVPTYTDFSYNLGISGYVNLDITDPTFPFFWMNGSPSNTPNYGPSGSSGPSGSPGPTGGTGPTGTKLLYTTSISGWKRIGQGAATISNPIPSSLQSNYWTILNCLGSSNVYDSYPYYLLALQGGSMFSNSTFPVTINFSVAYNIVPTVQINPRGRGNFINLTLYPILIYISSVSITGFTIDAIRLDTGAAQTTMYPCGTVFWQAYGW